MMEEGDVLSERAAGEILGMAGLGAGAAGVRVRLVKRGNDVYHLTSQAGEFFLKVYTKDWYQDDVIAQGAFCVGHEASAWEVLAGAGLRVPEVVLACRDGANPLGRPFLLTRRLAGRPLTELLAGADGATFAALLAAVGRYLGRMHAITFLYAGYIIDGGPTEPPDPDSWQHPFWSARGTQAAALAMLAEEQDQLPPILVAELAARLATMETALAGAWEPPRFTHGDCHAHQFFLVPEGEGWTVTGVVDMEVATAGDCMVDWLKIGIELGAIYPAATRWWEPLFAGYGQTPDFEGFRLRLLGWDAVNFAWLGPSRWPGARAALREQLLGARSWGELFGG